VEQNWTVRVRRGGHRLLANAHVFILANDRVEFGLDQFQRPFLQPVSERQETIICRLDLLKGTYVSACTFAIQQRTWCSARTYKS